MTFSKKWREKRNSFEQRNIYYLQKKALFFLFLLGTSAPELFTNIMGTFVTKSDLGIGTIVGSAVFNIFGVISVCGIFSGKKIPLDWYPITRDCFLYGITVILLLVVLIDERVFWWESLILVVCYTGYIIIMALNRRIGKLYLYIHVHIYISLYRVFSTDLSHLK